MKFGTFRNAQAGSNAGPDSILQAGASQFMDTRLRTDHERMQAETLQHHGVTTGSGLMTGLKGPDFMEMNRSVCPELKEELMWTTKNIDPVWLLQEQSFSGIAENTLKNGTATQFELERLTQAQPNSQWVQMNKRPTELSEMLNSRHNPLAPGALENQVTKDRSSIMNNKRAKLFSNYNHHELVEEDAKVYCEAENQTRPVIVPSKNLASERKRRKKLNDSLYLLRGLVPKISKLDKASIIGDAINYINELHQEVQTIEKEIAEKEKSRSSSMADEDSGGSDVSDSGVNQVGSEVTIVNNSTAKPNAQIGNSENGSSFDDSQGQSPAAVEQKMLEIEVDKLEEQTYLLRIFCQKEPGVLVQLLLSLESLNVTFLSASYTSLHESIMNTFIIEMKGTEIMDMEEVKKTITRAVAEYGLRSVILTT